MREIQRVTFNNGMNCYAFSSFDEIVDYISEKKRLLVAVNAEKILHFSNQMKRIISCNVGYSDGIGAVMALKKHGCTDAVKIPGCELWLKIVEHNYQNGKTFYLVGSKQEVIEDTVNKLRKEYNGIDIVGYRNGYLKNDEEKQQLLDDIALKKPDVVFVAMGSPKQELLMEEMLERHPAIYQGLGGSFDVYTGHVERAPGWWIKHNLEFAYRLLKQPSRIWRQLHLFKFLFLVEIGRI